MVPFYPLLLSLFVSEREECRWFIFTPNWNNLFTTLTVATVGLSASHNASFTSITCNKNVPPKSQLPLLTRVVFSILIIRREIDPKKINMFCSTANMWVTYSYSNFSVGISDFSIQPIPLCTAGCLTKLTMIRISQRFENQLVIWKSIKCTMQTE